MAYKPQPDWRYEQNRVLMEVALHDLRSANYKSESERLAIRAAVSVLRELDALDCDRWPYEIWNV